MSKYISSIKNKNITVNSDGISAINASNNLSGNIVQTPTIITSTTTLSTTSGNMLIIANPAANITINLPASPNNGQIYKFVNVSTFEITINTNNININFDGNTYKNIVINQYDKLNMTYYNNNWFLI